MSISQNPAPLLPVIALALASATCGGLPPKAPDPVLAAVSPVSEATTVGQAFAAPLAVHLSMGGRDSAGTVVTFATTTTGAGATFSGGSQAVSVPTDKYGVAVSPLPVANLFAGSFEVAASIPGQSASVTFRLTNEPGPPALLVPIAGPGSAAQVLTQFGPIRLRALDAYGNPVAPPPVEFCAPQGALPGGSFSAGAACAASLPGATGEAIAPKLTANAVAGEFRLIASGPAGVSPATIGLENLPGPIGELRVISGENAAATVGSGFPVPIALAATDAYGNPIANYCLTVALPAKGPSAALSASGARPCTDENGVAELPLVANSVAGTYTAQVCGTGTSIVASLHLTNSPGPVARLAPVGPADQQLEVGTASIPGIAVLALDADGNPVPGAAVTFQAPSQGANVTFQEGATAILARTDASGVARTGQIVAGAKSGPFEIAALSNSAEFLFKFETTPGPLASLSVTGPQRQSAPTSEPFPLPLAVMAADAEGNGVQGVEVSFLAPASGPSALLGGASNATATTGPGGLAFAPVAFANAIPGEYEVLAAAGGKTTAFQLTNVILGKGGLASQVSNTDFDWFRTATVEGTPPGQPISVDIGSIPAGAGSGGFSLVGLDSGGARMTRIAGSYFNPHWAGKPVRVGNAIAQVMSCESATTCTLSGNPKGTSSGPIWALIGVYDPVLVTDGTGETEAVAIAGIGANECPGGDETTICFPATLIHSGDLTVQSATAGIQEAANALGGPGTVEIEGGPIKITAPAVQSADYQTWEGTSTEINSAASGVGSLVMFNNSSSAILGLTLVSNGANSNGIARVAESGSASRDLISRNNCTAFGGTGLTALAANGAALAPACIYDSGGLIDAITGNNASYSARGIVVEGTAEGAPNPPNSLLIQGNNAFGNSQDGYDIDGGLSLAFTANVAESNGGWGARAAGEGCEIDGNYFEDDSQGELYLSSSGCKVEANTLQFSGAASGQVLVAGKPGSAAAGISIANNYFELETENFAGTVLSLDCQNCTTLDNVFDAYTSAPGTIAVGIGLQPGTTAAVAGNMAGPGQGPGGPPVIEDGILDLATGQAFEINASLPTGNQSANPEAREGSRRHPPGGPAGGALANAGSVRSPLTRPTSAKASGGPNSKLLRHTHTTKSTQPGGRPHSSQRRPPLAASLLNYEICHANRPISPHPRPAPPVRRHPPPPSLAFRHRALRKRRGPS